MKVQAEDLWPLILDFLENNFSKEDFKAFKKYFKIKVDSSKDPLVEAGGMKAMLACYLKNNKEVYKKFKMHHSKSEKEENGDAMTGKKRKRKQSESGSESESQPKTKRQRLSSVASEGPVTRRKSMDANEQATEKPIVKR